MCTDAVFILNLDNAALPHGWPENIKEIELQGGRYESDFDILYLPEELSSFLKKMRDEKSMSLSFRRSPAGINLVKIPIGATIRRVG